MKTKTYDIAVLPGDGIGRDVIDATVPLLEQAASACGVSLRFATHPAGAHHYAATGVALPESTVDACRAADAILFGAMGWPEIRYPDGTEIAPQLDLRVKLELYAGVRPVRPIPGIPLPLADPRGKDVDLVVVRESTEGLFASRGKGVVIDDREARDTMVITRAGCERVQDYAFRLAGRRAARRAARGAAQGSVRGEARGGEAAVRPRASPAWTRRTCSCRWPSSAGCSTRSRADIRASMRAITMWTRPRST